jgi:hypothetical protein
MSHERKRRWRGLGGSAESFEILMPLCDKLAT